MKEKLWYQNELVNLWCNSGFCVITEIIKQYTGLFTQQKDSGSTSGGWLHIATECGDDLFIPTPIIPLSKMTDWFLTELDSVFTWRQWSVAPTRRKCFNQIDGQVENIRRNCSYFAKMNCCWKQMPVLQGNWWTGGEQKEKLFLLCDDELLPVIDVRPSRKLMDRLRSKGENISTLRWWSVAVNRCVSFQQIDGQVENRRRKYVYFAMIIRCCYWSSVLEGNWWTGR